MLRSVAFLLMVLPWGPLRLAHAQRPVLPSLEAGAAVKEYVHTVWTTEDGLPQNSINDIVQTRDGYLWLATFGGLVRFDGMTFKVFDRANAEGLAGNRITALYEDRAGVLWIGHEGGAVSRYADGVFMHSTVADGLSGGTVFDFAEDAEGTLWMTTEKGLVRFSEGRFRVYTTRDGLPGDFIFSLLLDREGRLWISMEEGLGYYAEGRFTFFTEENGLSDPFTTALFEDRTGRLWVSSPMGFYYEDGQFTPFSRPGWPPQYVAKFWVDRQDNLWVGYKHGRLVRFASETASNARSDRAPAASISLGAQIRPIFEDREGNLWVGTNGAGLHRFHERPVIQYTPEDILPSIRVSRVTEGAPGEFWLNDGCRALVRYRGGTFTAYSSFDPDGLFQDRLFGCIGSLLGDRAGTIWIGNTKEGNHRLIRFRDGDYTLFTREDGVPDADIYALFEDRDGDLWLGTQGQGVVHFKEETAFAHYTTADGLVHDDVRFITQDRDGVLWFGTAGGLSRFEDGLFINYTAEADLAPGMVRALHIDPDGTLWVGTYGGGLSRLKDGHITRYTTDDGLAENFISRILEDEQGKLWMLGNLGLSVLPRAMLNDFAEGRIASVEPILLGTTEGMAEGNGGGQPAGWQAEDGRMWFPTIEGLAVVDARHFRWNTAPPPVVIERVLADGQEMDLRQDVAAPPGPRDLEIHDTGLSYVAPEQVRFKYKLDGYDEAWI
ncbi:MAG: two-component regulator propeller domain-containing protein, partial [Rhodothermales bacterium]